MTEIIAILPWLIDHPVYLFLIIAISASCGIYSGVRQMGKLLSETRDFKAKVDATNIRITNVEIIQTTMLQDKTNERRLDGMDNRLNVFESRWEERLVQMDQRIEEGFRRVDDTLQTIQDSLQRHYDKE